MEPNVAVPLIGTAIILAGIGLMALFLKFISYVDKKDRAEELRISTEEGEKWILKQRSDLSHVSIITNSGQILVTERFDHSYRTRKKRAFGTTSKMAAIYFIETSITAGRVKIRSKYIPMCEIKSLEVVSSED
jgi:hypothetical protein